jgi:hypothetical protein
MEMCTIIQGIPVAADSVLSENTIKRLVGDLIKAWEWEGKKLGRVELICDEHIIHVFSYEKPTVKLISLQNDTKEFL